MSHNSAEPNEAEYQRASGRAFVVIQQAAEPRTSANPAFASMRRDALDQPILPPLMISLAMRVRRDRSSNVSLADWNDPIEIIGIRRRAADPHAASGQVDHEYGVVRQPVRAISNNWRAEGSITSAR